MEIFTTSTKETQEAGRRFGSTLSGGEVICFSGDLGSGKTTFIQGLAEGLGIEKRIVSPTFIIMREYPLNDKSFFHIDLYRLEENIQQELDNLGISELLKQNKHIFAIEWGERAKDLLPENTIYVDIENSDKDKRKITISR